MSDEESSDDDYDFGAEHVSDKRFPVHDCCEFGDVEALKVRRQQQLTLKIRVVVAPTDEVLP